MERRLKKILVLFAATICFFLPTFAEDCPECDYNNFILSIRKEDARYLSYALYQNVFDTCDVSLQIGEFRWEDSTKKQNRIYLNFNQGICNSSQPWFIKSRGNEYVVGSSILGEDSLLTNAVRTDIFSYIPNSKILFYRKLNAGRSC